MRSTRRLILAALPLAIVLAACSGSPSAPTGPAFGLPATGTLGGPTASPMLVLTNQARAAAGLPALTHNSKLDAAAALLCHEIAQTGIIDHTQPGTAHPTPGDRVTAEGYVWHYVGENLNFGGDSTMAVAFQNFMNSPPHRANILEPLVTNYGDAMVTVGNYYCWVQDFAAPL